VNIKRPYELDSKTIFKFTLGDDDAPVLIQTRTHHLCYRPSKDIYDNIAMLLKEHKDHNEFKTLFELEQRLIERIYKKCPAYLRDREGVSYVKLDKQLLRLRNHVNNISVYDRTNASIPVTCLDSGHSIQCIIHMEHLWVTKECYGVVYKIVQVRLMDDFHALMIARPLFKQASDSVEIDPRFLKMLKMGVPIMAVIQKMKLEGVSVAQIDEIQKLYGKPSAQADPLSSTPSSTPPPPPRPPPPPPRPPPPILPGLPLSVSTPAFLQDIKQGNFKLRKSEAQQPQQPQIAASRKGFAPTLHDILDMRTKLKCLKKVYHSYYVPNALRQESTGK
jgi:hypothetical protein